MAENANFDLDLETFLAGNDTFLTEIDWSIFEEDMVMPAEQKNDEKEATKFGNSSASDALREIQNFIEGEENKNTVRKTLSDIKRLQQFMKERGETRDMHEIPIDQLDQLIASFIMSVKKPNGEEYETSTIRNMVSSFDRKLRWQRYPYTIVGGSEFTLTKETLKAKMKLLKRTGKGNRPFEAEPLSDADINTLFSLNLLGDHSPQSIINTLWLNNCIHFGMRGVSEHYSLCWGDVVLKNDGHDEFLELNERQTKTRSGENPSNVRKIKPRIYATGTDRCPITLYKLYLTKRPSHFSDNNCPFYLAPSTKAVVGESDQWFLRQRIGEKKIASLMKKMCNQANLTDKRLTNHSARKHLVQKLRDANVPPTEIMQISGHKNVQSVINYSSISSETQKKCSRLLSDTNNVTNLENTHPLSVKSVPSATVTSPNQLAVSVTPPIVTDQRADHEANPSLSIPSLSLTTTNNTMSFTPMFYGAVLNVGTLNFGVLPQNQN